MQMSQNVARLALLFWLSRQGVATLPLQPSPNWGGSVHQGGMLQGLPPGLMQRLLQGFCRRCCPRRKEWARGIIAWSVPGLIASIVARCCKVHAPGRIWAGTAILVKLTCIVLYLHTCIYIYIYIYTSIHTCRHAYMYRYMCRSGKTNVYIYIYIFR